MTQVLLAGVLSLSRGGKEVWQDRKEEPAMLHGSNVSLSFLFSTCGIYSVTLTHPSGCSVLGPHEHDFSGTGTSSTSFIKPIVKLKAAG